MEIENQYYKHTNRILLSKIEWNRKCSNILKNNK
jgi:hypothetical protein